MVVMVGILLYYLPHGLLACGDITIVAAVILLLTPLSFRYVRAVMLYRFDDVRYWPNC